MFNTMKKIKFLAIALIASLFLFSTITNASLIKKEFDSISKLMLILDNEDTIVAAIQKRGKNKSDEKVLRSIIRNVASKTTDNSYPNFEDVIAVIEVESSFNPNAKNADCYGLMQISRTAHRKKLAVDNKDKSDANITVGINYLKELNEMFKNRNSAIMAYNSGPGSFKKGFRSKAYLKKVNSSTAYYRNIMNEIIQKT